MTDASSVRAAAVAIKGLQGLTAKQRFQGTMRVCENGLRANAFLAQDEGDRVDYLLTALAEYKRE